MGRSNRTHQAPPQIEDLGDGSFYYNFNIEESPIDDDNDPATDEGIQYDYDQVRCKYPVDPVVIQECINKEGYEHQVNITNEEL